MFKPHTFVVLGLIGAACLVAMRPWETNAAAQEKKAFTATVWEYKAVQEGDVKNDKTLERPDDDPSEEKLNKFGAEGWELAASYTQVYSTGGKTVSRTVFLFKRPKSK